MVIYGFASAHESAPMIVLRLAMLLERSFTDENSAVYACTRGWTLICESERAKDRTLPACERARMPEAHGSHPTSKVHCCRDVT